MQTQTINISLPQLLVREVDALSRRNYSSRSDFIRQALLEKITRQKRWEDIFAYGEKKAREMGIKSEEEIDQIVYEFRHGKKKAAGSPRY